MRWRHTSTAARPGCMSRLIEVDSLTRARGPRFRLGPLSLRLSPGETLGIMGPNGSGKTTLLRILWGFLRPDAGTVSVLGHTPHLEQVQLRQKASFVGDTARFYEWMSVEEHIGFVGGFYPTFEPAEAGRLMARLGLSGDTKIGTLSRGGRVKLGLVSALAHRPGIVLLDEPTSGLDPLARADLLGILTEMAERGVGIVLSSHVSSDLDRIADSVLMLDNGQTIEYASTATLLHKYRNDQLDDVFLNAVAASPSGTAHRA